jgi:hypothetical protein
VASMSADRAREISRKSLKGPAIDPFVNAIDLSIALAASKGQFRILPWDNIQRTAGTYPTEIQKQAVQQHYVSLGYVWNEVPNPGPGDPRSCAYTELKW